MLSRLVSELVASGLSEQEIAQRVGLSQASINRIKLNKQKKTAFDAVDRLRALHRERRPDLYRPPSVEAAHA